MSTYFGSFCSLVYIFLLTFVLLGQVVAYIESDPNTFTVTEGVEFDYYSVDKEFNEHFIGVDPAKKVEEKVEVVFKLKVFKKVVFVFELKELKVFVVCVGVVGGVAALSGRGPAPPATGPSTLGASPGRGRTSGRSGGGLPRGCRCPGRRSR